ncbi:MAG: prepilin-type N-terminal cleavage/methylation domain-containing protein [Psychromonas sp.]|nr:prepilin-type N-terminal cleavage/methylation domain-containing protein [Alteromonadales bacterium]MCP5077059.1 prepilin-type N-terminal cleavage/methylation domain-containing protein [Psychromonas sp.]
MKSTTGVTLIELLVVIAIIGILASIAYPSFQSYMLKARRGDAKVELVKAQLKQTSLHILNPSYSGNESELGLLDSDYYTFTVISANTSTYSMKAEAKGSQTSDSNCLTLTIDQDNNHTNDDCW